MLSTHINASGIRFVSDHLAHIPRPELEVRRAINDWLLTKGVTLDAEQIEVVTLHVHESGIDTPLAKIVQRVGLTEAVLMNWQGESNNDLLQAVFQRPWAGTLPRQSIRIVDELPPPPLIQNGAWYRVFNGLFRRTSDARLDYSTLLPISAETLQSHIEALDYHTRHRALLDDYWAGHQKSYALACKLNFIAACNKQVSEGSLSDPARKLIWQAAGLRKPDTLRMSTLSIYGYAATDLLYLKDTQSDLTVLYMPGNSSPLLEFASEEALKDWVGLQCRDADKRNALKQHFRLADRPQGLDFSGLDTALEGLGAYPDTHRLPPEHGFFNDDGTWPPRTYVNYRPTKYNPKIKGDLFATMAERQRQRTIDDADFLITTDSEIWHQRWLGYLTTTLNIVAPLSLVIPGLAPLIALGGIAQAALGLEQVINGKTLQDKQRGVGTVTWGLFNALPLVAQGVARSKAIFAVKSEGFVPPMRLNEQIGYPLSPISPPRLPDLEPAEYFHIHDPIEPLTGADQAVAGSVIREPRYDGAQDRLEASIDGYSAEMVYDMERDVFIRQGDLNEVEPVGYVAQHGSLDILPATGTRTATNATRTATLRALGIDLPLPVQLPATAGEGRLPIPRKISCLWVGDKVLSQDLLDNLAVNTSRLKDSSYTLRLFLSNASPAAYAENLRLLAEHVPDLQALALEEQPFFQAFTSSKYHAQYQAALAGNGGVARNYASAADVLRYPMLNHEGGVYMDIDDTLQASGGTIDGLASKSIDDADLRTTPDGLLLVPPMSNEKLSMNFLYNNSMIASHAGNPTLEAISEEMYNRFQADPAFYDNRPRLANDPAGFYRHAARLSQMTGPALLTDVVAQRLPLLNTLREINNLCGIQRINSWLFVDLAQAQRLVDELLPLGPVVRVGGSQSWLRE